MSTLRTNNITDISGGSSSLSVPGAAKAWVNFNGTGTIAIRAQLNVSSITDNGVGQYTVNFTTAMPDANYCPTLAIQSRTGSNDYLNYLYNFLSGGLVAVAPTNGSYAIFCNTYDPAYVLTAVFR